MTQPPSRSWDAGRFLQTLAFFEAIPVISCLKQIIMGSSSPTPPQTNTLYDFRQPGEPIQQTWGAIDDVVMGGVSASSFQGVEDGVLFTGIVSTANSGGFASVRTRNFDPPLDLSVYTAIELRVKGDGQRYKFLLRDDASWDSVAYSYSFDTSAEEWITVHIPFDQMIPVFRAKTMDSASPLKRAQIRSLQLMLSKFEYDGALNPHFSAGEFRLRVQRIAATS